MANKQIPSEHQEQCLVFAWAKMHEKQWPEIALLNSSIMGVKLTVGQIQKARKSGMKKGYPDLFLPVPRGNCCGLFIELKRIKGGKVSKEQKWWLQALNEQGYKAVVCKGANEAINIIKEYLT